MDHLLKSVAERATQYLNTLENRSAAPTPEAIKGLSRLDEALPDQSTDAETVIAQRLDDVEHGV